MVISNMPGDEMCIDVLASSAEQSPLPICKRGWRRVLCRTESRRFTIQGNLLLVTGARARVTERDASTQQPTCTWRWDRGGDTPPTTTGPVVQIWLTGPCDESPPVDFTQVNRPPSAAGGQALTRPTYPHHIPTSTQPTRPCFSHGCSEIDAPACRKHPKALALTV